MDVRRIRQAATAGLISALLIAPLAGCTDDTKAEPGDPTSSPTSSPVTTEPSPTGPSIPPEAHGTDETSAKAFIRYYFDVFSAALLSGDTSTMHALALSKCESCATFESLISDTYKKHGHYETPGWRVEAAASLRWKGPRKGFVLRTRQHKRTLFNSKDEVVDVHKSTLTAMRIIVQQRGDTWRIEQLDVIR